MVCRFSSYIFPQTPNIVTTNLSRQRLESLDPFDDFVFCDKEMVDEYTPKAEAFIEAIKKLLK